MEPISSRGSLIFGSRLYPGSQCTATGLLFCQPNHKLLPELLVAVTSEAVVPLEPMARRANFDDVIRYATFDDVTRERVD